MCFVNNYIIEGFVCYCLYKIIFNERKLILCEKLIKKKL